MPGRPEAEKRLRRVLEIIRAINESPGITRRELAARFNVSERMIQKDLTLIRAVLPLRRTKPGPGSGYVFLRPPW